MSTAPPLVSIVIPVYNGSNFLRQAVESALAQTYPHCEVLVINDGSTDNGATEQIAKSYGQKIQYLVKPNEGIAKTLNFGIANMRGEYFSWLSHDDVLLPDKTQRQVTYLTEHGTPSDIIFGDYELIDAHANVIGERRNIHTEPEKFYFSLFLRFPVQACTSLIPRRALQSVGGFREKWPCLQDTDMWFRLVRGHRFIHRPEIFSRIRIHGQQGTVTRAKQCYRDGNALYSEMLNQLDTATIQQISHLSPYRFFIRCARAMQEHSFYQAAFHALHLARQSMSLSRFRAPFELTLYQTFFHTLETMQKLKFFVQGYRR